MRKFLLSQLTFGLLILIGLSKESQAQTCANITINNYFTDGNPYDAVANPVSIRIDRRGSIPSQEPITINSIMSGESVCMPLYSTWQLEYSKNRITLDNGAEYLRTGYFFRGSLRSNVISRVEDGQIVFVYKLIADADPELIDTTATVEPVGVELLGHFATGVFDGSAAEIVAHDPGQQVLMFTNAESNALQILDIADPRDPALIQTIDMSIYGGGINSVAIHGDLVATAVEAEDKTLPGSIVIFNTSGEFLTQISAGALPDMVTFSPNGKYILTANEGEPNDDYTIDPEGSVTIVDITNGLNEAETIQLDFKKYNELYAVLSAQGIRIFGPNATVAQDLEPEYITVTPDNQYAFVGLQENNAMAKIDLNKMEVVDIFPLGVKDHRVEGRGLDASDRTDEINIVNWPVFGMYLPDAIKSYEAKDGKTYIVTANEGDSRDYDGYSEEVRVKDLVLESSNYPNAAELQEDEAIGRMKTTTASGDSNNNGRTDFIYTYGTRSFSIWDTECKLIWDSGDQIEKALAELVPDHFNSTNDDNDSFKNRSDDKGPEPEAIEIMETGDHIYALVGLERQGGVMIFDITTPSESSYISYFNNRNFDVDAEDPAAGDLGVEDIRFIPADKSPNGTPLIVTANEVSGTISIFGVGEMEEDLLLSSVLKNNKLLKGNTTVTMDDIASITPNPFDDQFTIEISLDKEAHVNIRLTDITGRIIQRVTEQYYFKGTHSFNYSNGSLQSGVYLLETIVNGESSIQKIIKK